MVIVKITFDDNLTVPGFRPMREIEPSAPQWEGWLFEVIDGRIRGTVSTSRMESLPDAVKAEMAAADVATGLFVIDEPLSRVRLVCLDDGGPYCQGPSPAIQAQRVKAAEDARKANEAAQTRAAEEAKPADKMAKARQAKADKAAQVARGKTGPKRPPWAKADPVPPPSPPEEDAP